MSDTCDREALLREAFYLGFMVSREGFNGDCVCAHLAPTTLDTDYISESELRAKLDASPEFARLRDLAVKRLALRRFER